MSAVDFYIQMVKALDEIGTPYMIVGAFAGLAFGIVRATFDIDIIVDLGEQDFEALADRFPPPRYYADPEMMRNSTKMGIMFNLIDKQEGVKADLVPIKREPYYLSAFNRRIRQEFKGPTGNTFEACCAQPTDIIIGKLKAWKEGESTKHPADIYSILVFTLNGLSDQVIDFQQVWSEATQLGPEVIRLWQELIFKHNNRPKRMTLTVNPLYMLWHKHLLPTP
jgi:hypothetical protein